jgi:hypothetical protein
LYAGDPEEAPRMISETTSEKGIPIMILLDTPSCFYTKLNVPDGMLVLETKWGAHSGLMTPGCHCCYPACMKQIPVMISMNTIRFKCPI